MEDMMSKFGSWAFIVGLIIAVLAGVVITPAPAWLMLVLAVLGIIVGVLNVTAKESTPFLAAAIALVVSTDTVNRLMTEALTGAIATTIGTVLGNVSVFVAPAAIVVGIRAIFALASEE